MNNYQIRININEVYRYLGYKTYTDNTAAPEADETVSALILKCAEQIGKIAVPRYIYRVFNINKNLHLENTALKLSGMNAEILLQECSQCIVLAVTIGRNVDMLIRKAQISDMTAAVILDSCASCAVEDICNQLNNDLESEYLNRSLYLTDRFSPGYGDMPLSLQTDICRLLSTEKTMGLSAGTNLTLTPLKSITAIIGISDRPQPKPITGCINCKLNQTCKFRKEGVFCEKSRNNK